MEHQGQDGFPLHVDSFNRVFMDPRFPVSRIGRGALGGKAQGLVRLREALQSGLNTFDAPGIAVEIPVMTVICTDVFSTFIEINHLGLDVLSGLPDERIAQVFQKADLPFEILGDLRALIDQAHFPLAIRSSSLLEDSVNQPFAGIYATKMIPNSQYDPDVRFRQLIQAIKLVYASTYFKFARDYRQSIGRSGENEKMAVIIQEMVGKRFSDNFYPELSGVARSYNYYPMPPAKAEDGVVNLALGLGKIIVDGGISWTYSPAFPNVDPPFGSVKNLLKGTQTKFWVVNMGEPPEYDPTRETEYMRLAGLSVAEKDGSLSYLASTYDQQSDRLSIGTGFKGPRALTFAPLLVLKELPLNKLVVSALSICEQVLDAPVEIEFAMTLNPHRFAFLQVRKTAVLTGEVTIPKEELNSSNLLAASQNVLGNGVNDTIRDIVYSKPEAFDLKYTQEIVPELKRINGKLLSENLPYLLIALGRLGTSDPWLGIPIQWGQVCGAKAIIEAGQENVKVELSQGSHYFHNIINLGVKYFLLAHNSPYKIDWDWLNSQEIIEETRFIRHIRLADPLLIKVDGRKSVGVIFKPVARSK
ncbi:MAG: PEP/pyruvate-binding domain-containing protein [Anaerolineaceae bacterium]|nr:PEP/pyruvate-binding domain-containing protein [Anaerolineaceae bacterium]